MTTKTLLTLLSILCILTLLPSCSVEEPKATNTPGTDFESIEALQKQKPKPYKETRVRETLTKLEFDSSLLVDEINPNGQNYAQAIRIWMTDNPDRRIVTLMGVPHFSTSPGLQAVWITSKFSQGPNQRIVQLDLPTELPEEYTIATLIFSNGKPSGVIGVTPPPTPRLEN